MLEILGLFLLLAQTQKPNVLIIIADDVGDTEWAIQPNLQSLAASGVRFTRAYAYPVCAATRYATLFGRYSRREGFGGNETNPVDPLAPRIPMDRRSIAEASGMPTAWFGKWHSGRAPLYGDLDHISSGPFAFGFDHWLAGNAGAITFDGGTGYRNWRRIDDGVTVNETLYATIAQADAFTNWWISTPAPKFGVLGWSAAHDVQATNSQLWDRAPGFSSTQWSLMTNRQRYEATVAYMDTELGGVLTSIDLCDTFVFVMGDNGPINAGRPTGSPAGHWKYTTFEGGVHVSMVVAGPGVFVGVSDRLVSVVDVPATIAELGGFCTDGALDDSQSFADALGPWTGTPTRSFAFTERYASDYDDQAIIENESLIGQVTVRLKYRKVDSDGSDGAGPSQDLVYDLLDDPNELAPVALSTLPPQIRNRLSSEMSSLPPRK